MDLNAHVVSRQNTRMITLGLIYYTNTNSMGTVAGMTYMLATLPDVKAKLTTEIFSHFKHEDEIDMRSVANLPYLCAFIEETLRYYPPGPNSLWRITPPGGNTILGEWVPGNVRTKPASLYSQENSRYVAA